MSDWYEVTVTTSTEAADLVADVLLSEGSQGVSIKDKNDLLELYKSSIVWDYIDEKALDGYDERVYVKAVYGAENLKLKLMKIESALEKMRNNSPFNIGAAEIIVSPLDDTDWRSEWKKYYKPIVTSSVTVVPKWIKYDAAAGEKLLYINPGMAFGTGEHETTRMCLELLSKVDVNGKKVIDVGTGSGILGIAAVLSGAESAYMCDIDDGALITAKENIELNSVQSKTEIECADLLAKSDKTADLIFANITADILINLSKGIVKHLNTGGSIILSGIINSRLTDVCAAYTAQGLNIVEKINMGEWNAILLRG